MYSTLQFSHAQIKKCNKPLGQVICRPSEPFDASSTKQQNRRNGAGGEVEIFGDFLWCFWFGVVAVEWSLVWIGARFSLGVHLEIHTFYPSLPSKDWDFHPNSQPWDYPDRAEQVWWQCHS